MTRAVARLWTTFGDPVVRQHNNNHAHTQHAGCWVCRHHGTAYVVHPITGRKNY